MASSYEKLIQRLRERGETFTCAESCTGGLLSSEITKMAGVSDVYMGSFVTYSNRMKRDILNVPAHLISTLGAVSQPVALNMAKGAKALTNTAWAVSITGIAGPTGGTDKKPVGTVCFAIVGPGIEWTCTESFSGSRIQVQQSSAEFIARSLLEFM
ncbi:MAG: CinA family protein [Bdellovibrionales bacterium]|nr:CinA family protein [Bdellovibrionales bacterium]NQZ19059.1 CinA family protein [Bdellovibrionales bacterium]